MGLFSMAGRLPTYERNSDTIISKMWYCSPSEINIEGLDDYEIGDSADIEDIEFFTDDDNASD